jgi:hypothetical protein
MRHDGVPTSNNPPLMQSTNSNNNGRSKTRHGNDNNNAKRPTTTTTTKRKISSGASNTNNNSIIPIIINNPLELEQEKFLHSLSSIERESFFDHHVISSERRADLWHHQATIGESLINQFAWATPNHRALQIISHFAPIIEIGCGCNAYWCHLLSTLMNVDVVGYDVHPTTGGTLTSDEGEIEKTKKQKRVKRSRRERNGQCFPVQYGGPEVLAQEKHKHRTLLLCYPDEDPNVSIVIDDPVNTKDDDDDDDDEGGAATTEERSSMGSACLHYYTGDYIIHVGELYGDTLAMEQAPWGRSSSPEFQQQLASEFHCLLRVSIPHWLHVRDTLSVWKRSSTCTMVYTADESDEDDHDNKEDNDNKEDEEVTYRHIPIHERLPTDVAAPCLAHLL